MKCLSCGFDGYGITDMLNVLDDRKKRMVLCPNCIIAYASRALDENKIPHLPSEYKEMTKCTLCESDSVYFKDDVVYTLCSMHVTDLIQRNLQPSAWKKLKRLYPGAFLLHRDFYSYGCAISPVEVAPNQSFTFTPEKSKKK